ncbi:tetraacyldisaccharide 4'-kinase [Flagellimonas meridianipacifica]|uniref:Tetraacyldisaccharide 4'-kinase n=1 Tax=Flagellimonas meridianipacifica TaxID=1080225 RepID=A0A2T0M6G3_9FLAO|nr:tetraacyldisaccharide 4'-kinase [Allomuricauda pacifica]PRX53074.1 tetraacyldisaccharide 4'-kinase [Allomuricauda pacifica]
MAKDKILYFRSMWRVLRIIAFPISLVYALVVYVRNRFYDWGWFSSKKYDIPTVCVGNLSVGGTGKTPMIEYLVGILKDKEVAVLSRGYKRISEGFVLGNSSSTVADLGDEPFQIHKKFPQVQVAVDNSRQNGIEELMKLNRSDAILLDDAFQHRKVIPSFSILLTTYSNLYVDDWYLPTGNLRDSKGESHRADIIVVTKCPQEPSEAERKRIVEKLKPKKGQSVLLSWFVYADLVKHSSGKSKEWKDFENKKVAVVTGIAMPKPFTTFLESKGIQFQHLEFGDHHYFTENEVEKFNGFDMILTTEKDYVRLEGRVDELYYLEISHCFSKQDKAILEDKLSALF